MNNSNKMLTTIKTKTGCIIKCKACGWDSRDENSHLHYAGFFDKGCPYFNKIISAINKEYVKHTESEKKDIMAINRDYITYKNERRGILYKLNRYKDVIEPEPNVLVKYEIKRDDDGTYY